MEQPITTIIAGITVLVSLYGFSNREQLSKMLMNPYQVVHHKEYGRLFLHGLVHADFVHLFFNMFVFYEFGKILEMVFTSREFFNRVFPDEVFWGEATGTSYFLMLYIGAILVATVPSLMKHRDNPGYNSLGASGAVSAVLIAFILMFPSAQLALFFVIPMPAWVAGILFFVFEWYMNKRGNTGIAHDAHLYGAIFGVLFVTLIQPGVWLRFVSELGL
jgi:membrane associated rhomboid family serine protease